MANAVVSCPKISYKWEGGRSRVRSANIQIDNQGHVEATITKRNGKVKEYATSLNQLEVAALELAISSSEIFDIKLPDPSKLHLRHSGTSSISVKTEEAQRDLTYARIQSLRPLTTFIWEIITQADLSDAALDNDRIYELLGSIDYRLASPKVLQPYLFQKPLVESLSEQTEFNQIAWRLQALSCITTPVEFSGLVASQLDRSNIEHWRLWLTTLSTPECYGNLLKKHFNSLFPLFSDQIQKYGETAKTLDTPEGEAFNRFRRIMKNNNYSQQ